VPVTAWLIREVRSIQIMHRSGDDYRDIQTMHYGANIVIFDTMRCIMPELEK